MFRKSTFLGVCTVLLFLVFCASGTGFAFVGQGRASIEVYGGYNPIVGGEIGGIDYDDAFEHGFGFGIEFGYRCLDWFTGLVGVGYQVYNGDTVSVTDEEDGTIITYTDDLEDWSVVPLYVGGKFHLLPRNSEVDVYLRLDVGAAYMDSVDFAGEQVWDSSWVFMFDAGAGIKYMWEQVGVGLEVKIQYLGEPDTAADIDADGSWVLPIRLGISYHF